MALWEHDNHNDIPFFSPIKMFQELEEGDKVYLLNIKTLSITESTVSNLKIEDKSETVTDYKTVYKDVPEEHKTESQIELEKIFHSPQIPLGSKIVEREPVNTEYRYKSVSFNVEGVNRTVSVYWGTDTNTLERSIAECTTLDIVICTTEREAKQIKDILYAKCDIQMRTFKGMFNGAGWNYAQPDVILG